MVRAQCTLETARSSPWLTTMSVVDCELIDVDDESVVMPGLVDTHVHINSPGRTEWEGFQTATRAAAAGGVTTLIDMPLNSIPATTTLAGFETKVGRCEKQLFCRRRILGWRRPGKHR